jgi:hypothetical protein
MSLARISFLFLLRRSVRSFVSGNTCLMPLVVGW